MGGTAEEAELSWKEGEGRGGVRDLFRGRWMRKMGRVGQAKASEV